MSLLIGMYKEQKRGERRRVCAGVDYEEFGRVRYLRDDPRYPRRDCKVLDKATVDAVMRVQLEDRGPYNLARFFDAATGEPFLAEAAVYDESIQQYVEGVHSDLGFRRRLENVRGKMLPDMIRHAAMRTSYQVTPYQIDLGVSTLGRRLTAYRMNCLC